jgi:hypothetical protein
MPNELIKTQSINNVAEDKEARLDLIKRLQGDVGYILKRMGLTM